MLEGRGDEAQRLLLTRAGVGVELGQIHHVAPDMDGIRSVTTEFVKSARDNRTVPPGVRSYSSDNALLRLIVKWGPRVLLAEGLARSCASIAQQRSQHRARIELRTAALALTRGRLCERIIPAV